MTDTGSSERIQDIANRLKNIERDCCDLEMYDSAHTIKCERERIEKRTPKIATYFIEHTPSHATKRTDDKI